MKSPSSMNADNRHPNGGIKEPMHGCQFCNTTQILIYLYFCIVSENLYTRVIIWINTILNHVDMITVLHNKTQLQCRVPFPK